MQRESAFLETAIGGVFCWEKKSVAEAVGGEAEKIISGRAKGKSEASRPHEIEPLPWISIRSHSTSEFRKAI